MKRSSWHELRNDTTGAMAAMYALALPVLVAVAGIGFDYARIASLDTELQNAADQAALAGATQLDQESGSITRAIDAAQGGLVTNSTLFANDGGATDIDVPDNKVFFYETQADAEAATNPLDTSTSAKLAESDLKARFIRVVVETRTANYALTPVVGAISGSIDAEAVAGTGAAICRTPPLMICNPYEPVAGNATADFDADALRGKGLLIKQGGGGAWSPGNYGYLDVGLSNGAPGVREALGWDSYPGSCLATYGGVTTVDTQTGNIANAPDSMNTRFDIYDGGCEAGGNCPASINSRKDVVRPNGASGTNACKYHGSGWQLPPNWYQATSSTTPLTDAQADALDSIGLPRDMCHAISDDGSCTNKEVGNGEWDRNAYARVNYRRTAVGAGGEAIGTRWSWSDLVTKSSNAAFTGSLSSTATRYEVYEWEIANRGRSYDGVTILASTPTVGSPSLIRHPTPICSQIESYGSGVDPTSGAADRRRMSVAIINCVANNVSGNSTGVPVRKWIDIFLVEPSLDRGTGSNKRSRKDQIYGEIIGETDAGSDGETAGAVIRRDVPYLLR